MIDLTNIMSYRIKSLDKENERITYQMSTGKVLSKGSDDSVRFDRYTDFEADYRIYDGLKLQLEKNKVVDEQSDTIITDVKKVIEDVKTHLLKSLNSGMVLSDMKALAMNLRGIRENLIDFANSRVDGEYIFSGSDTTKQTFQKDENYKINGRVDFGGRNARLRKAAVDKGVYRDRGITIHDVLMYETDSTASDGKVSFRQRDYIIDEYGYKWKLNSAGDKLEKYDEDDNKTGDYLSVTSEDKSETVTDKDGNTKTYTYKVYTTETIDDALSNNHISSEVRTGLRLEVRHNYLDDLNKAINALEGYRTNYSDGDDFGKKDQEIDYGDIREILQNILDKTSKVYDAANIGHAELGGRNKIFESAEIRIESKLTHLNILMQETNGADIAKVAMQSKSLQLTYNALYSTVTKLNELSLINFLR